jgi:hypothetical protein
MTSYELGDSAVYSDNARRLPPLAWRAVTARPTDLESDRHRWLETTGPATLLTTRLRRTSEFTLLVTAATAEMHQTGPARIVSLSADPDRRNFTLAQDGSNLVFRLRTPLTGTNGSRPEFIVPGVFATRATRDMAITYDGLNLLAYVDGVRSDHSLRLGLGAAAFAPLFHRHPRASHACSMLYNALAFLPAGLLISRASRVVSRLPRAIATAAVIAAWSLSFELVLVTVSGRSFSWSNIAWTTTFAAAAAAASQWQQWQRRESRP